MEDEAMAIERKIDSATLPESFQELVEDAAEQGQPVVIERSGEVLGVVISPQDFALLMARKRALTDLGNTIGALRGKFADLPEDEAIAEAERAVLETRAEMRTTRTAQRDGK
jgi:PHD/YefM family antitoxin component YafN of YafNO toxin-antitoxin module